MTPEKPESHAKELDAREALLNFILDSEDDIEAMTEAEVDAALAERGIDMEPRKEELLAKIANACKQERLQAARQQRLAEASQSKPTSQTWKVPLHSEMQDRSSYPSLNFADIQALRAEAARLLGDGAAAYFRRYENPSEEDLIALIEDLQELDGSDKDAEN